MSASGRETGPFGNLNVVVDDFQTQLPHTMLHALRLPIFAQASRPACRSSGIIRSLYTTPRTLSSGPPLIYGPGSTPGAVPTDEQQATGLERLQLLGKMEGIDVFNMKKPEATKKGTMANPILIPSLVR